MADQLSEVGPGWEAASRQSWGSGEPGGTDATVGGETNVVFKLPEVEWADFDNGGPPGSKAAATREVSEQWTHSESPVPVAGYGTRNKDLINGGFPEDHPWARFPAPAAGISTAPAIERNPSQIPWPPYLTHSTSTPLHTRPHTTHPCQASSSKGSSALRNLSTGSELDWQDFSSGVGGRERGGGGVGWVGDNNGGSWPQHHGNTDSIADTIDDSARKEILMADNSSPLPPPPPSILDSDSTVVFRECFSSSSPPLSPPLLESLSPRVECLSSECVQGWDEREQPSFAASLCHWAHSSRLHPPPSVCQEHLLHALGVSDQAPSLNSPTAPPAAFLGGEEGFDWSRPEQRRRSVSPDVVPNLFRPRMESLVEVDFDHHRAATGLAELNTGELETMCGEMETKFARLSEELISSLQQRDLLAGEMEAKNRFVSALLRVQSLRHNQDMNGGGEGAARLGGGGGGGGRGGGKQWTWTHRKREKEEESLGMYLQTIIPYKTPEGLKWKTDTISQLTKVLKAIAEGSNTVPRLMSEYLQADFLRSPVSKQPHEDSLSSCRSQELATLSV